MIDEVEVDLERARAVRNRRGRQPARGDVKRDVPGMIEPGRAREADLADDLGPQMQRRIGLAPPGGGQFRPWYLRGVAHLSPQKTVIGIPSYDKAGHIRPGLYRRTQSDGGGRDRYFSCLLLGALGEGSVHFIFLDTGRGISGLTKVLLLGTVAHHAGMRLAGGFLVPLSVFLGSGLLVISQSPGAEARDPTPRAPFGSGLRYPQRGGTPRRRMPPERHQPCSFFAVSAITRP